MTGDGTWERVMAMLISNADTAGLVDWSISVDSAITRAYQHATKVTRHTSSFIE